MPEYPDITVYIEKLKHLLLNQPIVKVRMVNPFFLRTYDPPLADVDRLIIRKIERMGKRIIFQLEEDLFIVIHLMISGRLYWREAGCKINRRKDLAVFDFTHGSLLITEVATKKRASMVVLKGHGKLESLNPGGLELFSCTSEEFKSVITNENHTLKRTLSDPRILSGIGNAYSDEILHHAKLSPVLQTQKMTDKQMGLLFESIKECLSFWTEKLMQEAGSSLPKKVTAFHPDMAVHGKFGQPCPVCGQKVQRIRYVSNETNYCPGCQTAGKLLADRSLSRLLKSDWPKTAQELDEKTG